MLRQSSSMRSPAPPGGLSVRTNSRQRRVHEGGWPVSGEPGDLHFYRPYGTELDPGVPPRWRIPSPPPKPARRATQNRHQRATQGPTATPRVDEQQRPIAPARAPSASRTRSSNQQLSPISGPTDAAKYQEDPCQVKGLIHRISAKRAKSESLETTVSPNSTQNAASTASVTKFPRRSSSVTSRFRI